MLALLLLGACGGLGQLAQDRAADAPGSVVLYGLQDAGLPALNAGGSLAAQPLVRREDAATADGVVVVHIGKTGGSNVKKSLGQQALRGLRATAHGQFVFGRSPDAKYVFFVRDPVKRYASGFLSRLRQGAPLYHVPWSPGEKLAFERFPTPDAMAVALTAPDPATRAAALAGFHAIQHMRGLAESVGCLHGVGNLVNHMSQVLYVGRTEHLNEDYAKLLAVLKTQGVLLDAPMPLVGGEFEHTTPLQQEPLTALSPVGLRNARQHYAADYVVLRFLVARKLLPASYLAEVGI